VESDEGELIGEVSVARRPSEEKAMHEEGQVHVFGWDYLLERSPLAQP